MWLIPSRRDELPVSELLPVFTTGGVPSWWEARRCRLLAAVKRSSSKKTVSPRRVHSQLNNRYSPIFSPLEMSVQKPARLRSFIWSLDFLKFRSHLAHGPLHFPESPRTDISPHGDNDFLSDWILPPSRGTFNSLDLFSAK